VDAETYTTDTKTLNTVFVQNVEVLNVEADCADVYLSVSDFELPHIWYVILNLLLHTHQT
jgi:hypothetical protein